MTQLLAVVKLHRDKRLVIYCPHCIRKAGLNRHVTQTAYDLPLGPISLVMIQYEALQGYCSHCKSHFTLHPPGIDSYAHASKRLMHYVCRLCRFMPASKIPVLLPISASTASRWDKKILAKHLPKPDLDNLCVVLNDEKAIGAHHQYMTVVMNGETGEVLHLAEGKKKASLESFLQQLPPKQVKKIKFAKGVDRDRNEILAWIKHRFTSAKLEAFNATISRIVKRACGYRDLEYLYLKIRQEASPPDLQLLQRAVCNQPLNLTPYILQWNLLPFYNQY